MLLPVAQVTALDEVLELPRVETTSGVAQLEWPQEVRGLLEVGADSENLVDEILDTDNAVLAQRRLDDGVVGKSNALLVNLAVAALVDELLDALQVGVAIGNPRLDDLDHLLCSLGNLDEDTVVDLQQTQKLEDLPRLGGNLVDTLNPDEEDQVVLGRNVEGVALLGDTSKTDLLALSLTVLLDILLGALEDDGTLLLVRLSDKPVSIKSPS